MHLADEPIDDLSCYRAIRLVDADVDVEVALFSDKFDYGNFGVSDDSDFGSDIGSFDCACQTVKDRFVVTVSHGLRQTYEVDVTSGIEC
jgi:hypothetical protein